MTGKGNKRISLQLSHKKPQLGIENYISQCFINISDFESIDSEYEPRMLVPTDDFALGHWMKSTLHIINHAPQHRSKISVWNAINLHVRKRLIEVGLGTDNLYNHRYNKSTFKMNNVCL